MKAIKNIQTPAPTTHSIEKVFKPEIPNNTTQNPLLFLTPARTESCNSRPHCRQEEVCV